MGAIPSVRNSIRRRNELRNDVFVSLQEENFSQSSIEKFLKEFPEDTIESIYHAIQTGAMPLNEGRDIWRYVHSKFKENGDEDMLHLSEVALYDCLGLDRGTFSYSTKATLVGLLVSTLAFGEADFGKRAARWYERRKIRKPVEEFLSN